jgi:nucleotide-binding universal stress UspA family protein
MEATTKQTAKSPDGHGNAQVVGEFPIGALLQEENMPAIVDGPRLEAAQETLPEQQAPFRGCDAAMVGETILSQASEEGVDLIVMGAYGHSRASEFVLGGATRTMFRQMTVPILVSH